MILIYQPEVLEIIDRQDPNVLWSWYARTFWFPEPSIPGKRPPAWTEERIKLWIAKGIPEMYSEKANIPEMATRESAIAYRNACKQRLTNVVTRIKEEDEAERQRIEQLSRIIKVYRVTPKEPVAV